MAVLEDHASEFRALGARGEAHTGSDIDVYVYVEFEESRRTYDNFFALHELLEDLFQRRVDLVTDKSLSETKAQLILPTVRYAASHP
ncbi:MAG: nucleotidyltransferase domain-containing protein [Proteobacteria bacterium]|nr:nucleotidyltransferase domain-containing protein [Pseudomonadota bacterium]